MNTVEERTAELRKGEKRFRFTATRDGVTVSGFVRGFAASQAAGRVWTHAGVYGLPLTVELEEVTA